MASDSSAKPEARSPRREPYDPLANDERCPRCGGAGKPPKRRQNPFLDGLDIALVCEDCGLDFPAKPPPPPPSGRAPW